MQLTVFRQSSKTRPGGLVVYSGEDARPYADGRLILVADGMGGASSIRHQNITPALFDEDKLVETLFNGVFEDYSDEAFADYVKASFFELLALKDCYTDDIYNIKKSGYFASRIVAAIIVHEIAFNRAFDAEKLFEAVREAEGEAREKLLCEIGGMFAGLIREKLGAIAANGNFVYESKMMGLYLLATTLCASVYLEHDDCVEVIYLTAGDSRPYMWSSDEGLCQILEDEERSDGGLSNFISATEGADFHIRCSYKRFSKPCILFNATDGCFDSGSFISQLAFEKLLLEAIAESENEEQLSEKLRDFFDVNGRHDDSSSLAMSMFGYDSFETLKTTAAARLKTLGEEFFDRMPDLLDANYTRAMRECSEKLPTMLESVKSRFEAEDASSDYTEKQLGKHRFRPYDERIRGIHEKIGTHRRLMDSACRNIRDIAARNFIKLRAAADGRKELSRSDRRAEAKISDIEKKCSDRADDFMSMLDELRASFDSTVQDLSGLLDRIYTVGVPVDFCDYDGICLDVVEHCESRMDELFEFFRKLRKNKLDIVRQLTRLRVEYIDKNRSLAQSNASGLEHLVELILTGKLDTEDAGILPDDAQELACELEKYRNAMNEILRLETEEMKKALDESKEAFWNSEYVVLIGEMISDMTVSIPDELREEAREVIRLSAEEAERLRSKAELQQELFALYDTAYRRYLEE